MNHGFIKEQEQVQEPLPVEVRDHIALLVRAGAHITSVAEAETWGDDVVHTRWVISYRMCTPHISSVQAVKS